jgi:hypothetical protein
MGAIPQPKRDRHHLDILPFVVDAHRPTCRRSWPCSRQLALDVSGVSRDLGAPQPSQQLDDDGEAQRLGPVLSSLGSVQMVSRDN